MIQGNDRTSEVTAQVPDYQIEVISASPQWAIEQEKQQVVDRITALQHRYDELCMALQEMGQEQAEQ